LAGHHTTPDLLIENELFDHRKGAFIDATMLKAISYG
jgi:DNA-binding NtrC family response regulator